ncbi:tRNA lysidine(34) synthetase TilS [Mycoplasmatota bacterium]|nr:tRNA lysidine(34) synthetase TilS [Mycoplasmatota bacterium]
MITVDDKYKTKKIIIGVSGGIDSMVLFDVLKSSNIIVAHVNHNIRKESEIEYEFVKETCLKYSIPFESIKLDYSKDELKENFQSLAREKRYNFFFKIVDKYEADFLAIAHHGDDLIETILMSISRGSSLKGYGGFSIENKYKGYTIIRPLIKYSSEDIENHAALNQIKYYVDSSNKSDKYTRNRYRKEILPFLKKENPNIHHKYLQYSNTILDAYSFIDEEAARFLNNEFSVKRFNGLNSIVKKAVLSKILSKHNLYKSSVIIDNLISVLSSNIPNQEVTLSDDYILIKEYDLVYVKKKQKTIDFYFEINDFGQYELPDNKILIVSEKNSFNSHQSLKLCYNNTVFPILVRNRQKGDKMAFPFGTKKVKDIFIDSKIPRSKRETIPLIITNNQIVWIPEIKKTKTVGENHIYLYIV